MIVRTSRVGWAPNNAGGGGTIHPESGAFTATYSLKSRFDSEPGTNAEELLASAHASCFTMALSVALKQAGHEPKSMETAAAVHLDHGQDGYHVTRIDLTTVADLPGLDEAKFLEYAHAAKVNCPMSKALKGIDIFLEAKLI
ncbi:MAG: OsmC family peroxiredoxin [Candidatus Dormibacteria bacterium]